MSYTHLRRIVHLVAATGLALLTLSLAVPAVADAASYPPAYLQRTQFLTNHPTSSDPEVCIDRDILLTSATYSFTIFVGNTTMASQFDYLPVGVYHWHACLAPGDGTYDEHAVLTDGVGDQWEVDHVLVLATSGTWTWGSKLVVSMIT